MKLHGRRDKAQVRKAAEQLIESEESASVKRHRADESTTSPNKANSPKTIFNKFKPGSSVNRALDMSNHVELLSAYRVNIKQLNKHSEYQVGLGHELLQKYVYEVTLIDSICQSIRTSSNAKHAC